MALQIHFTKDPKLNCPLSYKTYELSKQLFKSYTWDRVEEKDDKIFYYCSDLVVERNKDFPLYICNERVFLNYENINANLGVYFEINNYLYTIDKFTFLKYYITKKKPKKRVFFKSLFYLIHNT